MVSVMASLFVLLWFPIGFRYVQMYMRFAPKGSGLGATFCWICKETRYKLFALRQIVRHICKNSPDACRHCWQCWSIIDTIVYIYIYIYDTRASFGVGVWVSTFDRWCWCFVDVFDVVDMLSLRCCCWGLVVLLMLCMLCCWCVVLLSMLLMCHCVRWYVVDVWLIFAWYFADISLILAWYFWWY